MKANDSATVSRARVSATVAGTTYAVLGVLAFSFSFPATVWSLDGLGAWTSAGLRGVGAAVLAAAALLVARAPRPRSADVPALAVVAVGCVLGFPLLTTLALQTSSTAHSAVVIGALPLATAAIAAARTRHRLPGAYWVAACAGAVIVIAFALVQSHGRPTVADVYLVVALVLCAAGYAEGGRLSARLPGWQVIAWGVVLAAPVNAAVAAVALLHEPVAPTTKAVVGLAYVAAVSQLGGFVLWYRGMGLVGVARASQVQLAQPILTLLWAVVLLGEQPGPEVPLAAVGVLACIAATQRTARRPAVALSPTAPAAAGWGSSATPGRTG